jgi:hypothetical protein
MCTVSWLRQEDGYQLYCNRDERRARPAALPPRYQMAEGVRYVAPIDAAHGGTWLAVNEAGLTLCLLNGDTRGRRGRGWVTRGYVISALIALAASLDAARHFEQLDLSPFLPFRLVAIDPIHPAIVMEWNGGEPRVRRDADALSPLVSSSFDQQGVERYRRALYRRTLEANGGPTVDALSSFHASHGAVAGPYSPCMHRDDAETVSFSRVCVSPERIAFHYRPAAPCQGGARSQRSASTPPERRQEWRRGTQSACAALAS